MAQLNGLLVVGESRFLEESNHEAINTSVIKIPSASGATVRTVGTSGQVLKSNGTSVYWGSDNNANYYHKTGTWSALTYTAAKVGSPEDLAFTIPTGTTASTVAVGNHGHGSITSDGKLGTASRIVVTDGSKNITVGSINPANIITSHQSVTNNNPTLAWGVVATVGKVGSTDLTLTAMAKPTPADIGALPTTTKYAGSSSVGGSATSAVKLDSSAGSATNPIYFSSGKPATCTYSLNKTVPSNAVFTDEKVKQTNTTSNTNYRVILSSAGNDTEATAQVYKSGNLTFNPSTSQLVVEGGGLMFISDTGISSGNLAGGEILIDSTGCFKVGRYLHEDATLTGYHAEGSYNTVSGNYSHAEGGRASNEGNLASGQASHAEGLATTASGNASHTEGGWNLSRGSCSHTDGYGNTASGENSHAEGRLNVVSGDYSHAEGWYTSCIGKASHSEGYQTCAYGANDSDADAAHAEGYQSSASGRSAHSEGYGTRATGTDSHAEGHSARATGNYSHAEGDRTTASGESSHAEGRQCKATTSYTHSEGYQSVASGTYAHAEGYCTGASASSAHSEGYGTSAKSTCSHAEGYKTYAFGDGAHASGAYTSAGNLGSLVTGHFNKPMTGGGSLSNTTGTAHLIGNGTSLSNGTVTQSNAFSVQYSGVVKAASTITASTTADYAEMFEWYDENPNDEDRVGYFITFEDGNKIRIVNNENDYILGISSGDPFILGNGDCDYWTKLELRDDFNRVIYEPAQKMIIDEETGEYVPVYDEDGNPVYEGTVPKYNPDYDPTRPYISRLDRKEWQAVGMLGVLRVRQDGTLVKNGYCTIDYSTGKATFIDHYNKNDYIYRVIDVINDDVAEIVFK